MGQESKVFRSVEDADGPAVPLHRVVADERERLQTLIDAIDDGGDASGPGKLLIALLDALPAMVSYWDCDLVNIFANREYMNYFGLTPADACGRHAREVIGDALFETNLPLMERALAGEQQSFERRLTNAAGETRHAQMSYIPYKVDGEVLGLFVLGVDVTGRMAAERTAQVAVSQYRSLVHSVPGGFVLLFDSDLRFVIADGSGLGAFGLTSADIEGRGLWEAFSAENASFLEPRLSAALVGQTSRWDYEIRGRSFQLTSGPVRNEHGVVLAGTVICTDITAERRAGAIDRTLHEVSRKVAANAGLTVVAEAVVHGLTEVFGAEVCTLMRFTGGGRGEVVATNAESAFESLKVDLEQFHKTASARVAATGEAATVEFTSEQGSPPLAFESGLRVSSAVPIYVRGEVWGSVGVASHSSRVVTAEVTAALGSFADLVALAITNFDEWNELTEKAEHDLLTGLANRNSFDDRLALEVTRSRRLNAPLVLALLDIDHFKSVNDRHGHQAGDHTLAEVATRLAETVRDGEMLARIGGEEFAWILPNTTIDAAWQAAERARHAVKASELDGIGTLTVSIGLTQLSGQQTCDDIFRNADSALYRAKRLGRDRTERDEADRS